MSALLFECWGHPRVRLQLVTEVKVKETLRGVRTSLLFTGTGQPGEEVDRQRVPFRAASRSDDGSATVRSDEGGAEQQQPRTNEMYPDVYHSLQKTQYHDLSHTIKPSFHIIGANAAKARRRPSYQQRLSPDSASWPERKQGFSNNSAGSEKQKI